jgi:small GTP-binding protein
MRVKVCVVGEKAVGKTSLIRRFVYDQFDDRYVATLGAKVSEKEIVVRRDDGTRLRVDLVIWDIMGEASFRELMKEAYFHRARGLLAVSDVTRKETLDELHDWVTAQRKVTGDIAIHFLANKVDLADQVRIEGQELAEAAGRHGAPSSYASAKSGENVHKAFHGLAEEIARQTS